MGRVADLLGHDVIGLLSLPGGILDVAKNSGKKAKQLLIEYPIEQPWTLVEPKEPAEKTRAQYRFAVKADPGKPVEGCAKVADRDAPGGAR